MRNWTRTTDTSDRSVRHHTAYPERDKRVQSYIGREKHRYTSGLPIRLAGPAGRFRQTGEDSSQPDRTYAEKHPPQRNGLDRAQGNGRARLYFRTRGNPRQIPSNQCNRQRKPVCPKENLSHLFERYRRADKEEIQNEFGIDLHYVKKLTELHGGRVIARRRQTEGTVYSVILPADRYDKSSHPNSCSGPVPARIESSATAGRGSTERGRPRIERFWSPSTIRSSVCSSERS